MIAPFTGHSSAYYSVFKDLFLREKKNHPSLHLAFQQRIFSILYISWVLHFFRRLIDPYYLITTKSRLLKNYLKIISAFTYTTNYFFCQVFFQSLKIIPHFLKFVKYFFSLCTLLSKILKRTFCNSDLQWAYLYHTFKNLSSTFFSLCTLLSKFFKRTFCNSDLQWAYLYHTFKNL